MASNAEALAGTLGSQISLSSPLGRWALAMSKMLEGAGAPTNTVSLLQAASGQVSLNSPLGQYCLKLSLAADAGATTGVLPLNALRAQVGAGPLLQWLRRSSLLSF